MSHEPNGEDTIPKWVYLTGIGLLLFVVCCFLLMLAGMM